jgi:hypothetical protein
MNLEEQLKTIRTENGKTFYEIQLKKSRITALVLASAIIISLCFLIFAFVQKERANHIEKELVNTKQALEVCQSLH